MAQDDHDEERWALERLRERGALTETEFSAAMARLTTVPKPTPVFDEPLPPLPNGVASLPSAPATDRPAERGDLNPPAPATASPDDGAWPATPDGWQATPLWGTPQPPTDRPAAHGRPGGHDPLSDAPAQPAPARADPMADVRMPPKLVAAGQRAQAGVRGIVPQVLDGRLLIAAATAVVAVSLLQTLVVVLLPGDVLDELVVNPVRAIIAVFAVTAPLALHATVGQARVAEDFVAQVTSSAPPTLLTVLLLLTFALLARRHWRRDPPDSARAAGAAVLRATLALTLVAVLAALITTAAGSLLAADGPQLRVGIWSTVWWAALFGAATAAAAVAPLLPRSHNPPPPIRRELAAALRGVLTGTVGLLLLALALVTAVAAREAVIADGQGVVEGTGALLLLLPTALVVTAGLALGVPLTVGVDGQPVVSMGLTGIEGIADSTVAVPVLLWILVLAPVAVLVLAGAGATWRAAADGVRANRVGLAVGPLLTVVWLLLALVASATVASGTGGAGDVLRVIGLDAAAGGGAVRVGLSLGVLTAVLLVVGTLAGWIGSLVAKRLWGRAPRWLLTAAGGRPDGGWPR